MTKTITLDLPISVFNRAQKMAQLLQRPLEELLTFTLLSSLPDMDDVPTEMQTDLAKMTWLSDKELWTIAESQMSDEAQAQLTDLSQRQDLVATEQEALHHLCHEYGEITLSKARAYTLLGLRSGKVWLKRYAA